MGDVAIKILFVASGMFGHMDFGGLGFVHLSQALSERGHAVTWLSFGQQVDRLRNAGCAADNFPEISQLTLRPIESLRQSELYPKVQERRVASLARLLNWLRAHKPDVVFIDRLLVCAGLAIEQLQIPYIAVGTPGGHWRFTDCVVTKRVNVHPQAQPVASYQQYGETLKQALSWKDGNLSSAWIRSPYCNLHFLSSQFYAHVGEQKSGKRLGISFGNQGDVTHLKTLAENLILNEPAGLGVNIFAGRNMEIHEHFLGMARHADVQVFDWIDFSTLMPDLSCMVFLGGVGSIWHCIEHGVPMVIAPGYIGDQLENARRIQVLGLGLHLKDDEISSQAALDAIVQVTQGALYSGRIARFSARENYTDTLNSFCERTARRDF
jgi:UDP:flavonoid glycosyltransferase YjiC (YdhE family)